MTQVFVLNSAYGLMTAVSAIDAGIIPPGDRVLVAVNTAIIPEAARSIAEEAGLAPLRDRFDRVIDLNALVAPVRPVHWHVRPEDAPALARLLSAAWALGDTVELYVQSPQAAPAREFVDIFPGSQIHIIGDGLMTYSPIRNRWPRVVTDRIGGVVYADTVAGVEPLLFAETASARLPVPVEALRRVIAEVADSAAAESDLVSGDRPVLVLGQYLAALRLISSEEEQAMQRDMIDAARRWDPSEIVFKPHPSSTPDVIDHLADHARTRGIPLRVYRGAAPAEVLAVRTPFVGAVAGFSTALPTLRALSQIPIAAVGTELLLHRLTPYENGNRIPVTIIDALTREEKPSDLQQLIDAVGYAMQPRTAAHLRPRAESYLAAAPTADRTRYFSAKRLGELGLPGGSRPSLLARTLASRDAASRFTEAQLSVRGAVRRGRRAWKALKGS